MKSIDLRWLALALAAGLLAGCSTARPPALIGGQNLFNGTDLANWKAVLAKPGVSKEDVWSVRGGLIICKGEPLGYIHTDTAYTNYQLLVEWRWAPGKAPGNSGIFLRINGEPKPLPRCIECQLKSGDAGDLYGFHGMKIDGEPDRRKEVKDHVLGGDFVGIAKVRAHERTPGRWNRAEIVVEGPNVAVWVNGKKVNEAFNCEVVAGPIGLQSEGGEVQFRTVRLQPLARP
jgi:hypothetical protein